MTAAIADHPYVACLLFWCIGLIAGWLVSEMKDPRRRRPRADDDITGIGA
jgi:hypothetical protein